MKKTVAFFLSVLLVSGIASAQKKDSSTTYLSLQQAIEYAYQHDQNVLNADLDEQIARAKVRETTGLGLPQLNGSFDIKDYVKWTFLFPADFFPGGEPGTWFGQELRTPQYSASAALQATQLLFDGTYLVGLQAAKTYRELSQKNLSRTRIETAVAVSKAYYNFLVNHQRIGLLEANVVRLKKLKDDTQAMYDNGFVEKIDIDRVVLTYNNMVVEKEKTDRLFQLSEYMLKYQIGMDIYSKVQLTDSLRADLVKNISVSPEKPDVTNRIEYSLLQTQERLQELDLKRYRSQFLPSIAMYGNLNTVAQRPKFDIFDTDKKWYPTGFFGASVSVPIFDGLQTRSRIDQSKLALRKIKNQMENTLQVLNLEVANDQVALQNALQTLITQEKNLELANEVYNVSKLKYDQGVGSNLEVITAETSLKEAQTNYYNSLFDSLVAKIDLDKATGKIK